MARPRKQEGEKRTHQLPPVRVTDAELALLETAAGAAGVTVTEYMRECSLSAGRPKKAGSSNMSLVNVLNRLLVELNRIGNNVNQIARQLNRGREADPHHLDGVLHELVQIVERIGRRV